MQIVIELRKRAQQIAIPVLSACIAIYFVYHAIEGDRGILAYLRLTQQIREAQATEAQTAAVRATLQNRVSHLSPESLDPDLLEERARVMLNYAHSDELVILLAPQERAQ